MPAGHCASLLPLPRMYHLSNANNLLWRCAVARHLVMRRPLRRKLGHTEPPLRRRRVASAMCSPPHADHRFARDSTQVRLPRSRAASTPPCCGRRRSARLPPPAGPASTWLRTLPARATLGRWVDPVAGRGGTPAIDGSEPHYRRFYEGNPQGAWPDRNQRRLVSRDRVAHGAAPAGPPHRLLTTALHVRLRPVPSTAAGLRAQRRDPAAPTGLHRSGYRPCNGHDATQYGQRLGGAGRGADPAGH